MNREILLKSAHEDLQTKVIIKNTRLLDPVNNVDEICDIKIENGIITKIGVISDCENFEIIDGTDKITTQGFFDMHVHFREPGFEDAEDLITGSNAAMAGGYTGIAMMPNTEPSIDNVEIFRNLKIKCKDFLVDCHPIPAITRMRKGDEIVDMESLLDAGALGFTDDGTGIQKSKISLDSLIKSSNLKFPIMVHSQDNSFGNGAMNEGTVSKKHNIPGILNLVEDLMICRDIMLAEYSGGHLHIQHISTIGAVEMVRNGKKRGINITAEATPHHFSLTDMKLAILNTNFKMAPPLRTEEDRLAVIEGLKDGTIDTITTDHAPHTIEKKSLDFVKAPFGVTGLETALGVSIKYLVNNGAIDLSDLIFKLSINPRKILKLDYELVKVGKKANLVIFDTKTEWVVSEDKFLSKSVNNSYLGETLYGKIHYTINNNKIFRAKT
ncbi:MAG: dihydroorotase [Candidatus Delongbacteria bacterium]|nr:dihydroorotase [Candidatus Delongbacteria bacterium]MBN2833513.1 dihydroorotase [Candidatus Delongbacteria bacterium]